MTISYMLSGVSVDQAFCESLYLLTNKEREHKISDPIFYYNRRDWIIQQSIYWCLSKLNE